MAQSLSLTDNESLFVEDYNPDPILQLEYPLDGGVAEVESENESEETDNGDSGESDSGHEVIIADQKVESGSEKSGTEGEAEGREAKCKEHVGARVKRTKIRGARRLSRQEENVSRCRIRLVHRRKRLSMLKKATRSQAFSKND